MIKWKEYEKKRKKHLSCNQGFSLVELIVVIAIMAVLVSVLSVVLIRQIGKARESKCLVNRDQLRSCYRIRCLDEENMAGGETVIKEALKDVGEPDAVVTKIYERKYTITDVCGSGGIISAFCEDNGELTLTCDKHPSESKIAAEAAGAYAQSSEFIAFMNECTGGTNSIKDKGDLFKVYYEQHPETTVMEESYQKKLLENGLNKTLTGDLYWWTYPVTDSAGNVQYTVTYANKQSNVDYWTDASNRGKMNPGYVVIVNGKTYYRTNEGKTVEPGNTKNNYQTEEALEQDLIKSGYKVLDD